MHSNEPLGDPIAVANYRTRLEAEVASNVLTANGIPFVIQSAEGMLYGPMPAGATLLVREEHAALARELLGGGEQATAS